MDKEKRYDRDVKLTKKYNLNNCSCGRCCNAESVDTLIKALEMYASMELKEYPHLGERARRTIEVYKNDS